jgi:hypothetical protein
MLCQEQALPQIIPQQQLRNSIPLNKLVSIKTYLNSLDSP